MASTTSGLTRRRGGAAANNGEDEGGRVSSPAPRRNDDRAPETSYEDSANGHRIAFDPRDISESAERNKQPKLTLMEEIILMGLKDKQVGVSAETSLEQTADQRTRVTSLSGTITYHTPSEGVS
jgi:Golgi phosphoprotein 3